MGRTGRRPGTRPNCTFLAIDEESLLQAAGLLRLHGEGFVEPVRPRRHAAHLLAHQILALCIQEKGIPVSDWWGWVAPASAFAGLMAADRQELVDHMLAEQILAEDGGRLSLGPRGERLYGFRNFSELYAVFSTPETLTVLWGLQEVGTVDSYFVASQELDKLAFTLGARTWRATSIDWTRGVVQVEPADHALHARWFGRGTLLHHAMSEAIRQVLIGRGESDAWSRRARDRLSQLREAHTFLPEDGLALIPDGSGYRWWTFAGGRANNLLGRVLESALGEKVTTNNLSISLKESAGKSEVAIRQALAQLRQEHRPNKEDAHRFAADCARGRLTKFQPCLPPRLEAQYLADTLTDVEAAAAAVACRFASTGEGGPT
jgi:ATP-dependent Lhr-like helicase